MLWRQRKETDITELLMKDFKVKRADRLDTLEVVFHGPQNGLYEGGVWKIRVYIPPEYPFEPPILFFVNRIYHPNIDFASGFICSDFLYWDYLDKGWIATNDLVDIFQYFIPRLLIDPDLENPRHRLVAKVLKHDEWLYNQIVRDFCKLYAKEEDVLSGSSSGYEESGSEECISEEESG